MFSCQIYNFVVLYLQDEQLNMKMDPSTPDKPKKHPHREEEEKRKCVTCYQHLPISELTKLIEEQSLQTLQKAASIHNFHYIPF